MAAVIRKIQEHVLFPLSIDTPDAAIAAAALEAYDAGRAGNRFPILNSISEARLDMFDLYEKHPFMPVLLVTEGMNGTGEMMLNRTADQIYATAKSMVGIARERIPRLSNDQVILDPGIMPIGSDSKGYFRRLMGAMALIHQDSELTGVNISVGLSNFTAMLPTKRGDGSPVKGPLESAFLTLLNVRALARQWEPLGPCREPRPSRPRPVERRAPARASPDGDGSRAGLWHSVRATPAWVAAVGLGAAGGSYWLWLEPATGSLVGPGAEARMDQIVLDARPGRYRVDVFDAATGEVLSRESVGGPPLVLGVPSRGVPVAAEIRPVRSSPSLRSCRPRSPGRPTGRRRRRTSPCPSA